MKPIYAAVLLLFVCSAAGAQPWAPTGKPMKLEEIAERYEAAHQKDEKAEHRDAKSGKGAVEEDGDYQFDRWKWYWQRHTDENGYMVSPMRNMEAALERNALKAQSKTTIANLSNWTSAGPYTSPGGYNGIGRINIVAFHPTNPNEYIIGSAGGGAWRTQTDGMSWTSLYTNLPVLGVSDVDYNPQNPNTIYLCTGDRDGGDTYSIGLLKSLDGGITWDTTGLKFPVNNLILLNSLIINPLDTSSLTVGTSQGVFRSFDAGATWVQQLTGDFKQVLYHPTDTNIIYAARNGYNQADIFRTADGGYNWQQVTNFGNSLRVTMAVTPANPNIVKLVVANVDAGLEGVYHSGDAGESFSKIFGDPTDCTTNILSGNQTPSSSDCSGQGWYDLSIAISPTDENDVVVGGTNTWRSVNGGAFFDLANQWTGGFPGVQIVHADKHWHAYNPLNPGVLYECNDGGIYKTSNPQSQLWTDLTNGLNITQFYRLAVSNVAVNAIAGAQDNGTKAIAFTGGSDELTGGDGMDCQMDYSDPDVYYTSSQYGSFNRTTNGGINFDYITDNIGINIAGEWITPLIIHPTDPFSILAGFDHVYHSTDRGDSWTDISPTLNANLRAQRLTMSPANTDRIWGLWNDNTIKYTSDFGNTWLLLSHSLSTITDIMADPKDGDVLWVSIGGYGNQKVYRYKVGGGWTNQGTGLPKVPANCFMKDSSNATLYVGTDIGVYYKDTSMSSWAPYDEGLPTAEVTDLAINYATNELWAATYGRGLWKSPRQRDTSVTTSVAGGFSAGPYAPQVIVVLPNPNKGAFAIKCTDLDLRGRNVDLVVTGIDGRIVQQRSGLLDGQGGIAVDISGAAKGVYAVEVFSRGRKCGQASFVVE